MLKSIPITWCAFFALNTLIKDGLILLQVDGAEINPPRLRLSSKIPLSINNSHHIITHNIMYSKQLSKQIEKQNHTIQKLDKLLNRR